MTTKSHQLRVLVLTSLMVASVITMTTVRASAADKADDVFMDEGDGDFDSAPAPAKQTFPKADATAKKAQAKVEAPAAVVEQPVKKADAPAAEAAPEHPRIVELNSPAPKKEEAPAPAHEEAAAAPAEKAVEQQAAAPTVTVPEKELMDQAAAPADDEAPAKTVEKKHSTKHAEHSDEAKTEKSHKSAHHMTKKEAGIYVVTNGPCPMTRKPASEEPMITVKPSKKIWVQEVDDKWVRGFNKAGEPGFISRDCVHAAE